MEKFYGPNIRISDETDNSVKNFNKLYQIQKQTQSL